MLLFLNPFELKEFLPLLFIEAVFELFDGVAVFRDEDIGECIGPSLCFFQLIGQSVKGDLDRGEFGEFFKAHVEEFHCLVQQLMALLCELQILLYAQYIAFGMEIFNCLAITLSPFY